MNIPDGITKLNEQICRECSSLETVIIPSTVTEIVRWAFRDCPKLQSVRCYATIPPTMGVDVFYNTNNCPIYVPAESVSAYKTATNWSTYASRIQAIID